MAIKIIDERAHLDEDVLTPTVNKLKNTSGASRNDPATMVSDNELRTLLPMIEKRSFGATKKEVL